jgi:L-serine dehydratase
VTQERDINLSLVDLFTIGIGPSSSHTVGPMRAANRFAHELLTSGQAEATTSVTVHLYGSLALTGHGHGTDKAVIAGLTGARPEDISPDAFNTLFDQVQSCGQLSLGDKHSIDFTLDQNLSFHYDTTLPGHPNGMIFTAADHAGEPLLEVEFYSVGGGFVLAKGEHAAAQTTGHNIKLPHPFSSGEELLAIGEHHRLPISEIMLANETAWREESETLAYVAKVRDTMMACIKRGCEQTGRLPGDLAVRRRAHAHYKNLTENPELGLRDPLTVLDWVNLFALAVSEENAAGGRVVTAPTNGAAGVIPAVLCYYLRFCPGADDKGATTFLLTAAAIGVIYKKRASISGAEVGCQGEVGVACSMAAAALTAALGGTNEQIENAAEIGMEHNLGLTCDPVGGLVQVPCIERNAMGATKAINAARLAFRGDGQHMVSLDKVIETMRQTGLDMATKYKETSQGGLAVNVVEC